MPLTVANENTCVVLAGDHMQMSPKVYSQEAKTQRLHTSLLERLYRHYDNFYQNQDIRPLTILMRMNYRSRLEILRFIAAVFYGGPDVLVPMSEETSVEGVVPLTFYSAQGREVQDSDSTSYYNIAEMVEVVDRIEELYVNWPNEWGPRKAEQIGVVTPYADQVYKIRASLRKKGKDLRNVVVERVMNVQGKEFRALFISTVRTRHLVETSPNAAKDPSECDGDVGDFGFLSDQKLLNTAFTRAQSLVAVVGDPIALCAIGECSGIWRTFLKHCNKMDSIYPKTVTFDSTRMQVYNLLNSSMGQNISRLNAMAREDADGIVSPKSDCGNHVMQPLKVSAAEIVQKGSAKESTKVKLSPLKDPNPFDSVVTKGGFFDDWSYDYKIEPDDILIQLAREAIKTTKISGSDSSQLEKISRKSNVPEGPLKIECVQVKEEEGHAVLYYNTGYADAVRKRNLVGANDYDKHYDSDNDESNGNQNMTGKVYDDMSTERLKSLLISAPQKYKLCRMRIKSSRNMYAEVIDSRGQDKEIKISSRIRCGRAFDLDEVVVELLTLEDDDTKAQLEEEKQKLQGQVIGILRRAINPQYRMFVCMVEQGNTGLMVPLNRGIPKIYNLETVHRQQKTKKGHVCVYTFTKDKEIVFHHYEPIDPTNTQAKLFIVRYLKWDADFYSPLGIVVGVLPAGTTIEAAMKIIDVEYHVPKEYRDESINELNHMYPSQYVVPDSVLVNRSLLTDNHVVTIDPSGSDDLDDAISIESLPDGNQILGIHISDVSFFIRKDSYLDIEAEKRGTSLYPVGEDPLHMIPERLSTNLCSLLPNKTRLSLSIFLTVNTTGDILNVQPKRTTINVQHKLTYENVEALIKGSCKGQNDSKNLQEMLLTLYRIAQIWRSKRLGNAALYQSLTKETANTPEAHLLVEELMIMTNHQVAKLLLARYPKETPLRCQMAPNELKLDEWRQQHIFDARNSVALTQPFLYRGLVCKCIGPCTCIPRPSEHLQRSVEVSQTTWEKILLAVEGEDLSQVRRLVCSPELHPQSAVAQLNLRSIQERSSYICSGDLPIEDDQWHYNINLPVYTHFTSPIRRYIDLIVHRMVNALIDNQPSPYSQADMTRLCTHLSEVGNSANRYEAATHLLHFSAAIAAQPLPAFPVIESIDNRSLTLKFPTIKDITRGCGTIHISQLNPAEQPVVSPNEDVTLKWKQRIYDLSPEKNGIRSGQSDVAVLDPKRFVYSMPASAWQTVLQSVIDGNILKIMEAVFKAEEVLEDSADSTQFKHEVTSESGQPLTQHYAEFSMNLKSGSVARVQVAAEPIKGLLTPHVQLYSLTPKLDLCIEHRTNPLKCFTNVTTLRASKQNFKDLEQYRQAWMPVIAMESASGAISNDESAVIHNVDIKWEELASNSGDAFFGTVAIPYRFCMDRQLGFSTDLSVRNARVLALRSGINDAHPVNNGKNISEEVDPLTYDFMCIRYTGLPSSYFTKNTKSQVQEESEELIAWVGHCVVTEVTNDKNCVKLTIRLLQSNSCIPVALLGTENRPKCTVEWIPKNLPDRRIEKALIHLDASTQLAQCIALGRNPPAIDTTTRKVQVPLKKIDVPYLSPANQCQDLAVQHSLTASFSLIQGPPGTGKSVTAVRLAYLFVQANRQLPTERTIDGIQPQVLICGPSNKSVDVLAGYLMRMGSSCPKVIRVYSERIERKEFPLPREPIPPKKKQRIADSAVQEELKKVTLHYLIRQSGNHYSNSIKEIDQRILNAPDDISNDEIKEYLSDISRAEQEELKRADIVLCTCSASAGPRMLYGTNVQQLIVDEAGMCTEPETLVPIVNSGAPQVVLVGDHRQLQPIVLEEAAKDLGLSRSLFERYKDKAKILGIQYRMHDGISAFPSDHFYDGRLEPGSADQSKQSLQKFWPNGRGKPITFCHVVGRDEALPVATEEGSLQSRSNMEEAAQAVRVASMLVRRYHVRAKDIMVLSQYRAQCTAIEKLLLTKGEKDISVTTVVQSQGSECDYVILSAVRSLPRSEIEPRPTRGWIRRNLGSITNENQINVAITRAKKGLIIIGNKYLLQCDPMWKKLLKHYQTNKKVVDAKDFMTVGK